MSCRTQGRNSVCMSICQSICTSVRLSIHMSLLQGWLWLLRCWLRLLRSWLRFPRGWLKPLQGCVDRVKDKEIDNQNFSPVIFRILSAIGSDTLPTPTAYGMARAPLPSCFPSFPFFFPVFHPLLFEFLLRLYHTFDSIPTGERNTQWYTGLPFKIPVFFTTTLYHLHCTVLLLPCFSLFFHDFSFHT